MLIKVLVPCGGFKRGDENRRGILPLQLSVLQKAWKFWVVISLMASQGLSLFCTTPFGQLKKDLKEAAVFSSDQ
jgi:hypothetical protein